MEREEREGEGKRERVVGSGGSGRLEAIGVIAIGYLVLRDKVKRSRLGASRLSQRLRSWRFLFGEVSDA